MCKSQESNMVAAEPGPFFQLIALTVSVFSYLKKKKVKPIPFCSQPAAGRPCQGAADS